MSHDPTTPLHVEPREPHEPHEPDEADVDLFRAALDAHDAATRLGAAESTSLARRAARDGARIRRRRQAAVGLASAAVVVVAVGVTIGIATHGGDETSPEPSEQPTAAHTFVITGVPNAPKGALLMPYVLDADGWTADPRKSTVDHQIYRSSVPRPATVELQWREASDGARPALMSGPTQGATALMNHEVAVYGTAEHPYVVGPVRRGRYLVLQAKSGVSAGTLEDLATYVHR